MPKRARREKPYSIAAEPVGGALVSMQGSDFSGRDFKATSLHCQNFFESIFNGCSFERVDCTQSVFQHTEFTEATLRNCTFTDTSFDHADFVLTEIADVQFIRCSFQNAEWRDSTFVNSRFRQCVFRNTTTSLTKFEDCDFDEASAASFIGPSKRYTLFSSGKFNLPPDKTEFLRTTYGLLSSSLKDVLPLPDEDPLLRLSLLYYLARLDSKEFVQLIVSAMTNSMSSQRTGQRLRIRYITEVIKCRIRERSLSVFAIQLLEHEASSLARKERVGEAALDIVNLLLALRVSLRNCVQKANDEVADLAVAIDAGAEISMVFDKKYGEVEVRDYVDAMSLYCGIPDRDVRLAGVREGSTIVDLVVTATGYVSGIAQFIKYSLSEATIVVKRTARLRGACKELRRTNIAKRARRTRKSVAAALAPASTAVGSDNVANEIVASPFPAKRPIEVFVDAKREQVLILDGRVRVTINLA